MAALTDRQTRFVATYLGVAPLVGADEVGGPPSTRLLPLWQDAKDTVDAQLQRLSDLLRIDADPNVQDVADEVASLLQPIRVGLVGPLMEFDKTPGTKKAVDGALAAIDTARRWIESDPRVAAVDQNPWGVPVAVVATLSEALDRLERNVISQQGVTA